MANPLTTIFDASNPHHRTVQQWAHPGSRTWQTEAKAHARAHGEAKVCRADGSVVRYWLDEGTMRQRTYHNTSPAAARP